MVARPSYTQGFSVKPSPKLKTLGLILVFLALVSVVGLLAMDTAHSRRELHSQAPKANEVAVRFLNDLYPNVHFRVVCDPSVIVDSPRWRVLCVAASDSVYPPLSFHCPFLAREIETGAKCVLR